jgi:hypothetical protein
MNRQRYLDLINPAIVMVAKKGEDYNQGETSLKQYFPFGDYSHIQMIHLKALRLVSLASLEVGLEPNYDSIEDTLYDLLNYAVFYLDYLQEHKNGV